ncbi:hypothetical protein WJX84_007736 [Apatococcus fuscideae]|uniref:RanBD1 domain-containing protein n=1 Tax=Apatococcus fuscideae TaxID=2026836 RepID=A0AAW1SNM7_9CHLO
MTGTAALYGLQDDTQHERFLTYSKHKKDLNKLFISWAQEQYLAHPDGDWDEGVLQYLTRSKQLASDLLQDRGSKRSELEARPQGGPANKKQASVAQDALSGTLAPSSNGPAFFKPEAASNAESGPRLPGFTSGGFGSSVTNTASQPASAPGSSPTTSAAQPAAIGGPSSSSQPAKSSKASPPTAFGGAGQSGSAFGSTSGSLFSFPASPLPSSQGRFGLLGEGGPAAGGDEEADEEAGDGKIKGEVEMDANTEYLFKDTLSLSMYAPDKPKKWEGRGQGTLTLRRPKAESSGGQPADPFAVFTTEAGRILVNGRLHHGQAPTKEGKRKHQLRFPLAFAKAEGQPVGIHTVLATLADEDHADALIAALKEHMPS